MKLAILIGILAALTANATTTNNDDSCDIGLYPAATLLLPYFEVETAKRGTDTLLTITNVGALPQIAHVTLWTDWAYPVLTFNVFLTGYDVQALSLYDVVVNGIVAPGNAAFTAGGTSRNAPLGPISSRNSDNSNLDVSACSALPGVLAPALRDSVRNALVNGLDRSGGNCGTKPLGSAAGKHPTATTAVGYVTIDVTSRCTSTTADDPAYFANEILFDNVLTGEYAILDNTDRQRQYAVGNPLVHIRAIPEGGAAGSMPLSNAAATPLPYTFYGRYINGQTAGVALPPHLDRRQPLPSTFAARYIQSEAQHFDTTLIVWREGIAGPATCSSTSANGVFPVVDAVRFDEHENLNVYIYSNQTMDPPANPILPVSSRTNTANMAAFPILNTPSGDISGWLYLNLDSGRSDRTVNRPAHPGFPLHRPSQNWVEAAMTAGNYATTIAATALGNGCSPASPITSVYEPPDIRPSPAGGIPVCPPGFVPPPLAKPCVGTGTNVNP